MKIRIATTVLGMTLCMVQSHAQNINGTQSRNSFEKFRQELRDDFDDFRQQCMSDFVAFMRNPWKEFEETAPIPLPKEEVVPPVVMPKEDRKKPIDDKPVVIHKVIPPTPVIPQPQPVVPIQEVPVVKEHHAEFSFFGTSAKVRYVPEAKLTLHGINENHVADAFGQLAKGGQYDNMLLDCLALRKNLQLSDWAYLQMLKALSEKLQGRDSNEAVILMAYLFMQSGYQMRMASNANKLYMLFATKHILFDYPSYTIDGSSYYSTEELPAKLSICQVAFPKEKMLSLQITTHQQLTVALSTKREITSLSYPTFKASIAVNKNVVSFYETYPTSMIGADFMSRWALYANTPMDSIASAQLYPALRQQLKGLSQIDAANRLLNWVQTGFKYEYDDKVWGHDRAFFAEESLYYPYCDCEDRCIMLSRLVRDLLGLKVILVYYPGHLAMAVGFNEDVNGDYITLNGQRFLICDPTYINAPVGRTMPKMDNEKATVILLDNVQ